MEDTQTTQPSESLSPKELAVGVQFRHAGSIHTLVTQDATLTTGERVVARIGKGTSVGMVAIPPHEVVEGDIPKNAGQLLHRASPEELNADARQKEQAIECFFICRNKIREHDLPMKLVDSFIEENGKEIVFSFYAEQRVDFRGLIKDLAVTLHMRIEMRQIGSRDEAKYRGCIGPCGLVTCCSLYLRQFYPISISMAKHQGLSPNPAKLTGMCGKLKCCLFYEHEVYDEYRKDLPKIGLPVSTSRGAGKIIGHNILKKECNVRLYSGGEWRCAANLCKPLAPEERDAAIEAARRAEEISEERSLRRRRMKSSA